MTKEKLDIDDYLLTREELQYEMMRESLSREINNNNVSFNLRIAKNSDRWPYSNLIKTEKIKHTVDERKQLKQAKSAYKLTLTNLN